MNANDARELIMNGNAPDNLHVGGYLDLIGCTRLTSLPDNLQVGGYLHLSGCTRLTSLPDNMHVGGALDLSGCTGLTSLPDNLQVGGNIELIGCTGLTNHIDDLEWPISVWQGFIVIGCKKHPIEEWENFSDDEISKMNKNALGFWREKKPRIIEFARKIYED